MNYNFQGIFNLANAVVEQAIKDVVDKKKNGKPKTNKTLSRQNIF